MGDSSGRFGVYIYTLLPKAYCISKFLKTNPYPDIQKMFVFTCSSYPRWTKTLESSYLGSESIMIEERIVKSLPKKVFPPKWTKAEASEFGKRINDTTTDFVIIPVCLQNKKVVCNNRLKKPLDDSMHIVYLVYNKPGGVVELWDPQYVRAHVNFRYKMFMTKGWKKFFNPMLETFGLPPNLRLVIPIIKEQHYRLMHNKLAKAGLDPNFSNIYTLFLIAYIHDRIKKPHVNYTEILGACTKRSSLRLYTEYSQTMTELLEYIECKVEETPDLERRVCKTVRAIAPVYNEGICPEGQVHDVTTNQCIDFKDFDRVVKKANELDEHAEWAYNAALIRFFISTHPQLTTILPSDDKQNEFVWYYQPKRPYWVLETPTDLHEGLEAWLSSNTHRFMFFLIHLTSKDPKLIDAHANLLIIDRDKMIVERYEPNGKGPMILVKYGGAKIDAEIQKVFGIYGFTVQTPYNACPRALHGVEGKENDRNVTKDFEGNCVVWCLWYLHMRMLYPDLDAATLLKHAIAEITRRGSFKHYINGFHVWLLKNVRPRRRRNFAKK